MSESDFWEKNHWILFQAIKGLWAPGNTIDDLINEARIGLWEARKSWNSERGAWNSYAVIIARRRVMDMVTASLRQKHRFLIGYSELGSTVYNIPDESFDFGSNKSSIRIRDILENITLTPLEQSVIDLYLMDYGYTEIGKKLNITYKSVDNALQRIMKKIKLSINSNTEGSLLSPSASTCA